MPIPPSHAHIYVPTSLVLDSDLVQSNRTLRIRDLRLRLALHTPALLVRSPSQENGRVDDDEDAHSNDHDRGIQDDKVRLVRDEVPRPPLRELDGPVDAADVDHGEAHQHGAQNPSHLLGDRPPEPAAATPDAPQEVGAQHPKDGHGDELERDACHHDVRALLLARGGVGGRGGRAANGLDDEGDQVAEAKDDGVQLGRDHGGGRAEDQDEAAQEDVEGRGEEDGGDDEGDFLGDEGVAVVGALGGVGARSPAYDFGYMMGNRRVSFWMDNRFNVDLI